MSIQSLILVDEPYFNEPGYEGTMHKPEGRIANKQYNLDIRQVSWPCIPHRKTPDCWILHDIYRFRAWVESGSNVKLADRLSFETFGAWDRSHCCP